MRSVTGWQTATDWVTDSGLLTAMHLVSAMDASMVVCGAARTLRVKVGDRVRGGETVMGVLRPS